MPAEKFCGNCHSIAIKLIVFLFCLTVHSSSYTFIYEILDHHNCVVWFYIHFNYLIVYHVIILYFSVLIPIVSILLCMHTNTSSILYNLSGWFSRSLHSIQPKIDHSILSSQPLSVIWMEVKLNDIRKLKTTGKLVGFDAFFGIWPANTSELLLHPSDPHGT